MDTVVKTRGGKLRGNLSNGVATFKGIPYAAPPFGANRLLPPRPVERWEGLRDALAFGPKSPQVSYPPGIAEALAELVGSGEDCLTLNIWTPDVWAAGLPVMVWILGGMFDGFDISPSQISWRPDCPSFVPIATISRGVT